MTKRKSNNSNCSLDRYDLDPREIPLNGFNRFDPKYISIGPKALRESPLMTTNLKCATLRHGGRYGGSLTERGINPVLKKASPPSVATVSKEFNASSVTLVEVKNNITNSCSNDDIHSHKRSSVQQTNENILSKIYSIEPGHPKPWQMHSKTLTNSHKTSIINQPLPEIPPKMRNQQLLNASNLNKSRDTTSRGSKSALPINLSRVEQPPLLPPKNRNRYINERKRSTLKPELIQSNVKTCNIGYDQYEMRKSEIYAPSAEFNQKNVNLQKSIHQVLPHKTKNRISRESAFRPHPSSFNSKTSDNRLQRDAIDFTGKLDLRLCTLFFKKSKTRIFSTYFSFRIIGFVFLWGRGNSKTSFSQKYMRLIK